MWVMNQYVTECIECHGFRAHKNSIVVLTDNGENIIVGKYKSEERAQEIVIDFMVSIQQGATTFWMPKE